MSQDTVCSLMSRATTTTHVEEQESELELQRLDKKDEPGERSSERCRRRPAKHKSCCVCVGVDKRVFPPPPQELAGGVGGQRLQQQHGVRRSLLRRSVRRGHLPHHRGSLRPERGQIVHNKGKKSAGLRTRPAARCHQGVQHLGLQVEKATMTDGLFPEPVRVRHKERGGRWGHASPFMRGSTIVRSQTFSPGARSQYVCRVSRWRQNWVVCSRLLQFFPGRDAASCMFMCFLLSSIVWIRKIRKCGSFWGHVIIK